jgi:hypothetical protein
MWRVLWAYDDDVGHPRMNVNVDRAGVHDSHRRSFPASLCAVPSSCTTTRPTTRHAHDARTCVSLPLQGALQGWCELLSGVPMSMLASGRPTSLLRPTTTTCCPSSEIRLRCSACNTPAGVHGKNPPLLFPTATATATHHVSQTRHTTHTPHTYIPSTDAPTFVGCSPSTSLAAPMAPMAYWR